MYTNTYCICYNSQKNTLLMVKTAICRIKTDYEKKTINNCVAFHDEKQLSSNQKSWFN